MSEDAEFDKAIKEAVKKMKQNAVDKIAKEWEESGFAFDYFDNATEQLKEKLKKRKETQKIKNPKKRNSFR